MNVKKLTLQFRVTLKDIQPEVWRRIVVPATYSFWDLHVAIQDAMGWLDCHLHAFRVRDPDFDELDLIGIPDDDAFDGDVMFLPGWEIPITEYFSEPGDRADYDYDFGDGWEHEVVLEEISERVPDREYPSCLAGARACPPEDCGGVPGYYRLLSALADPGHEEHERLREWVGGSYDPSEFSADEVVFEDPRIRWRNAFQSP